MTPTDDAKSKAPAQTKAKAKAKIEAEAEAEAKTAEKAEDGTKRTGKQGTEPDFSSEDFYSDVATVLEEALGRQPQRQDLRYKLLEVYAAQGRREPFVATALEYRKQLHAGGHGDWDRVVALGRALFVDNRNIDDVRGEGEKQKRLGDRPGDEDINKALADLAKEYVTLHRDGDFLVEVDRHVCLLTGHPSPPLYHAERLSKENGGAQIYLGREESQDVLSYKVANALGQGLTALRLGRQRLVTGSTSGQQGVATAMAAAHLGLECTIYMREEEARTQSPRSQLIRRMGAQLKTLSASRKTPFIRSEAQYAEVLNTVRDAALKDWIKDPETTLFVNGLAAGPEPFPTMLRDFHANTGRVARQRLIEQHKTLPAVVVAVLDGSLDPLNFFHPFLAYRSVRLVGVENEAIREQQRLRQQNHYQDMHSLFFSEDQVAAANSILHAQGFPSTRREHAWLRETGRVDYIDSAHRHSERAIAGLARTEGLLINDASGHALGQAMRIAAESLSEESVLVLVEHVNESEPSTLT